MPSRRSSARRLRSGAGRRASMPGLTTYLRLLDRDRDWAALCLVGVPAAGEAALAHRDRLWAPVVERLAPSTTARPAAAGALAALDSALRAGLSEPQKPLTALRSEALELVIGPVRGAAAARRQASRPAAAVRVRETEAEAVRALLTEPGGEVRTCSNAGNAGAGDGPSVDRAAALGATLARALHDGDGPALLQAVVGFEERRAAGEPVDETLRRRTLDALADAWSCGLPLTDVAVGAPGGGCRARRASGSSPGWPSTPTARRGRSPPASASAITRPSTGRWGNSSAPAWRTGGQAQIAPPYGRRQIRLRNLDLPLSLTLVDPTIYGEATSSWRHRRTSKRRHWRSGHDRRTPSWAEPTPTRRAPRPCRAAPLTARESPASRSPGDERRAGRPAAADRGRGPDPRRRPPRLARRPAPAPARPADRLDDRPLARARLARPLGRPHLRARRDVAAHLLRPLHRRRGLLRQRD